MCSFDAGEENWKFAWCVEFAVLVIAHHNLIVSSTIFLCSFCVKGFGFVIFKELAGAEACLKDSFKSELDGRVVCVRLYSPCDCDCQLSLTLL